MPPRASPWRARARSTALACAFLLLATSLLAPALGVLPDARTTPAATTDGDPLDDEAHVARSLWRAKHTVQVHHANLLVRPFWEQPPTGEGVRVAVVDTGVDASHPDLAGAVVLWRDFVGDENGVKRATPYDDNGHGTHVAGIIAGRGHLQANPLHAYWLTGARGMAPGADLIVAKAMDARGMGNDARVAEAILWALDPKGDGSLEGGADVINLSIGIRKTDAGGPGSADFLGGETRRAVNLALLRGVPVVVSSGNDGAGAVLEPGDVSGVITVGALAGNGQPAAFSNHGEGLNLLAPGVLLSTFPESLDTGDWARDGYAGMAGTSMAAPVVSGLVALMMDADPTLAVKGTDRDHSAQVRLVKSLIVQHATPIPGVPPDEQGAGVVNAYATLAAVDDTGGALAWSAITRAAAAAVLVAWALAAGLGRVTGRRKRRGREVRFERVG